MATTTNYSWTTPDDTALVKDGAAAIRSLGTAIDSTVFTNAGAAVAKATVDAKGDLIAGTADNTVARLAVGANGTTLVADSAEATGLKWATPAGGGKVLQVVNATTSTAVNIATTALTDSGITATITPTSATSKIFVIISMNAKISRSANEIDIGGKILRDATTILDYTTYGLFSTKAGTDSPTSTYFVEQSTITYLDSPATTSATTYKLQARVDAATSSANVAFQWINGQSTSSITLMEIGA
jgi:hypothetical protein